MLIPNSIPSLSQSVLKITRIRVEAVVFAC